MEENLENRSFLTEINVTPFVDVLLVLLIIFMITAPIMTRSIGVDLPRTRLADQNEGETVQRNRTIVIGLDADNQVIFERKRFEYNHFFSRLPELTRGRTIDKIFIQADKTTSYDHLLRLMVHLKNQGYDNIGLVFEQNDYFFQQ
jgi:biopolymer transport protein ExbD